jgi:hypothetical protein
MYFDLPPETVNRAADQKPAKQTKGAIAMSDDLRTNGSAPTTDNSRRLREESVEKLIVQVRQALSGLRYGQIVITVQDGLPVQIERTEKTRLR